MREVEIELSIGDILECGDYQFTVIDIEDANVSLKVTPLTPDANAIFSDENGEPLLTADQQVTLRYDAIPR